MEVNKSTCRLCLLDNAVVKIFGNGKTNILEMIKRCCQFEIMEEENLPHKLCLKCLDKLKMCHEFVLQCVENNQILKHRNEIMTNEVITIEQGYFIKCEPDNVCDVDIYDSMPNSTDMQYDDKQEDDIYDDKQEDDIYDDKQEDDIYDDKQEDDIYDDKQEDDIYDDKQEDDSYDDKQEFDTYEDNEDENHTETTKICPNARSNVPPGKIMCDICGNVVKKQNINRHKEIHSTERKYGCDLCPKKFKVRDTLQKHIKGVHTGTRVICDYCKKVYTNRTNLKSHIVSIHLAEKKHACDICDSKFVLISQLKSHMKTHTKKKPVEGEINDSMANSIDKQVNDTVMEPNIDSLKNKKDNIKKKKRRKETNLKRPTETTNKPSNTHYHDSSNRMMCDICGKLVKRDAMRVHKETHSTERKYGCDLCPKKFKVRDTLQKHIKGVHTDTSVICDICKKVYCDRSYLKKHIISVHIAEKIHACDICDRKFVTTRQVKLHKRSHSQEKPYQCRFCDSTFALPGTKTSHERLHLGITPYKCPLCSKAFAQLCNLKSHFKYNHKDSNFKEVYKFGKKGDLMAIHNSVAIPKIATVGFKGRKTTYKDDKTVASFAKRKKS